MSDWTAGYVADIGYTYGYYPELNPLRAAFPLAMAGWAPPSGIQNACELGFGQGMSVNVHAAATDVQWHATDFNPAQASFAQELARVSGGGNCHLRDDAFADFCQRVDLPDFDYIGLHGIWSWISDENRGVIVDFIRRKLKVGGVLYISYNTLPGWAGMLPVRQLMTQHADVMGVPGQGITQRIGASLDFVDRLMATNPIFARQYPLVADRVKKMKEQNRNYLAHEYFNRDWHPMPFSRMAEWLSAAKVQFVGSAHLSDHVDAINVTPDQVKFLAEIPDPMFREQVRDFMTNTQFRREYWVKGARRMTPSERIEALRHTRFVMQTPRADVELKVNGTLGEASLTEAIYKPILDLLADYKPHTLAQIEGARTGGNLAQTLQAATLLMGKGTIAPVQDDAVAARSRKASTRLNQHIISKARSISDIGVLASPLTGGGINVPRFHQLFLPSAMQGKRTAAELAEGVFAFLEQQGQRLIKDGKPMAERADNIAELTRQAQEFLDKHLPLYRGLSLLG